MNGSARYIHPELGELPLGLRVLYFNILVIMAIAYLFAMIQIYVTHAGLDGKPGLSVHDIQIAYGGDRSHTRLEAALNGPMRDKLPDAERKTIIRWIRSGADEQEYRHRIKPIIDARCILCHNGKSPLVALTPYDEVKKLADLDTGMGITALVRVSHIHLFGLTFIFGFMGLIFSHARLRSKMLQSIVICVPFAAIVLDIASWWLTKVSLSFAYVVVIGGALMGIAFAVQWAVSLYQLCFRRGAARRLDERG